MLVKKKQLGEKYQEAYPGGRLVYVNGGKQFYSPTFSRPGLMTKQLSYIFYTNTQTPKQTLKTVQSNRTDCVALLETVRMYV